MEYTRHYPSGTSDYTANGSSVQVSYALTGMDGAAVIGQLDTNLLTEEQIDQLCVALTKAGALLPWSSNINIVAVEAGRRTFTVTENTPPVIG